MTGHHVDDLFLTLHHTLDPQQLTLQQGGAIALEHRGPDHHVGITGLVFEGDEHYPGCGTRPLTAGDQAGHLHHLSVPAGCEIHCPAITA